VDEGELEAERNAKDQKKREMRGVGGPINLQKNAVSTPSSPSEPRTKLTTGSRMASKRNIGR
jgi:hypothetical protein